MTRQSSETGRHLLSEPGTPLSPPVQGDVFFPIEGMTQQASRHTSSVTAAATFTGYRNIKQADKVAETSL